MGLGPPDVPRQRREAGKQHKYSDDDRAAGNTKDDSEGPVGTRQAGLVHQLACQEVHQAREKQRQEEQHEKGNG